MGNDALCDESNWDPDDADNGKFATSMFVSPKWTIHLDPSRPGGPTGFRFASLIATQGINAQCGIMFSTVFVCNWLLAGFVAMAITGLVRGWEKFIRTDLFRKWAVFAGVNLADVVPGGLAVARKNTADDEGVLLMSLGSDGNESDSDSDEEAGFIRRDVKSHIIFNSVSVFCVFVMCVCVFCSLYRNGLKNNLHLYFFLFFFTVFYFAKLEICYLFN